MKEKAEPKWDEQDYDEMRDEVYRTISDIYYELYLNRKLSIVEIKDTVDGRASELVANDRFSLCSNSRAGLHSSD